MLKPNYKASYLKKAAATSGMVVLFPGFLIYHFISAHFGVLLPFAGLFGPAAAAYASIGLAILVSSTLKNPVFTKYEWLVFGFFLYTLFYVLVHMSTLDEEYAQLAGWQSFRAWLLWMGLFFVGSWLPIKVGGTKAVFDIVLVGTVIFLAWYFYLTGSVMWVAQSEYDAGHVSNYQGFARSIMVIGLFLCAYQQRLPHKLLVVIGSVFVLFMFGARSEFAAFIITIVAASLLFSITRIKRLGVLSLALVMTLFVVVTYGNINLLEGSRHFALLDLSMDASWAERGKAQSIAIEQIVNNPFLGHFGGHVMHYGDDGYYAHNVLSAWVNYGLLGISGYLVLNLVPLVHASVLTLIRRNPGLEWKLVLLFSISVAILILVSKSIFYELPALVWGFYARALRLQARESNSHTDESCSKSGPTHQKIL